MSRPLALVLAVLFLAVLFVAAPVPAAFADGEGHAGAYAGWIRSYGAPSFYREPHGRCAPAIDRLGGYGCAPDCAPRIGYGGHHAHDRCYGIGGTSWAVMRRYLAPGTVYRSWHRHPRSWWIRRWPYRTAIAPGYGGFLCQGTEVGPDECPLLKAALDDAAASPDGEDRLIRGLERFRLGAYDKAAEDFRAVADADPSSARAWYGRLMCAYVAKDWKDAASSLRRLATLGELDARDRLDEEGAFESLASFRTLADALDTWTKINFHDADAQLVCGWALLLDGRTEAGRAHVRAALRFTPGDAAASRMLADLDGTTPPRAEPAAAPRPAPAPAPSTSPEPADPALRLVPEAPVAKTTAG